MGQEIYGNSIFCLFCCEPKTSLKNKVYSNKGKTGRNLFSYSFGGQKSEIKFVSKTAFQLVILGENLPLPHSVAVDIPCLTTTSLQFKWLPWLICLLFLFLCVFLIRIFAIYLEPTWTHKDEPLNSKYLIWLHLQRSFLKKSEPYPTWRFKIW